MKTRLILGLSHGVADLGIAGSSRQLSHSTDARVAGELLQDRLGSKTEKGDVDGVGLPSEAHGELLVEQPRSLTFLRDHGTVSTLFFRPEIRIFFSNAHLK